ncbi:MAG: DNA topology modulation protein [Oscillospiraceae bacterium]|nr:DNA topology modulation protein [Oscillospiraceae bacterium]
MERIMIIGCGGAGKSTLARQLGEKLGLPVVHLDKLFWKPNWVQVSQEEFDALHQAELAKDKWIIDGNFNRTIPERIARCDTIIYLDFNRFACLWGVLKRNLTNRGVVRPDMGEGCPEKIDFEFLKWVWNFNKDKRERYYQMIDETKHAKAIVLKNRRAVKRFLKELTEGKIVV